jgi:hypothetical protein
MGPTRCSVTANRGAGASNTCRLPAVSYSSFAVMVRPHRATHRRMNPHRVELCRHLQGPTRASRLFSAWLLVSGQRWRHPLLAMPVAVRRLVAVPAVQSTDASRRIFGLEVGVRCGSRPLPPGEGHSLRADRPLSAADGQSGLQEAPVV